MQNEKKAEHYSSVRSANTYALNWLFRSNQVARHNLIKWGVYLACYGWSKSSYSFHRAFTTDFVSFDLSV